jgi:MFS family permease
MSSLHALFSIGGMVGSAIGGAVAARGISPRAHLAGAAVACFVVIAAAIPGLLPHDHHAVEHAQRFRISRRLTALALLAFCFFLGEGAVADWSGLYLARVIGAGAGTAALGYSVFSAVMATARLGGDALINRFGRTSLVRAGSILAAAGIGLAVSWGSVPVALIGFALTGAGCAVVVPIAFASAGRMRDLPPGMALTAVTAVGYFGLFAGPPSIGFLADALGLRWALLVVAGLLGAGAALAGSARQRDAEVVDVAAPN